MKYVRYTILLLLLLLALSACGTAVLWIMGKLISITFDNLVYAGFKIGFIATILLIVPSWMKKKKSSKYV